MKKIVKNIFDRVARLFLLYTLGVFLGLVMFVLEAFGIVRVLHKERIPHKHNGMIGISNHESLVEPILNPLLFFYDYFYHPFKLCPISIPDKKNYMDKLFWWWLRFCAIAIDRNDRKKGMEALHKMKDVLKAGGIILPFPEGGRTCFGKAFTSSPGGKKIRVLDEVDKIMEGAGGLSWVILQTNPTILPIWVEGGAEILPNSPNRKKLYHTFPRLWKKMTIKIGRPVSFSEDTDRKEIAKKLTTLLLVLADEKE